MLFETSEHSVVLERLESTLVGSGLPRIPARVLAYLLVCDPPAQSAEELATAVRASSGSISTATQLLIRANFLQRSGRPGDRRSYYAIAPNAWEFFIERELSKLETLRATTAHGLAALGPDAAARAPRLKELDTLAGFLLEEFAGMRERWHARSRSPSPAASPPRPGRPTQRPPEEEQ